MPLEHQRLRPRFGRIPEALAYSAVSRSRFYEWARERPKLLRKNDWPPLSGPGGMLV